MTAAMTLSSIGRRLERRASQHLSISQYRVLAMAAAASSATSGRLSRLLELAKPTITAAVEVMVQDGLLTRTEVAGDRRSISLQVTPAGYRMLEAVEATLAEMIDDLVDRCDDPALVRDALAQLGVAMERRSAEREMLRQGALSGR